MKNNRLLSKLTAGSEVREDAERRTGEYTPVQEDSSTASTKQFAAAVAFGKKSKGFTLVEIMLVIALIAVLMGFGLPSYQRYLQRTQIAEGFTLATPIQMAVSEAFYETGQAPMQLSALGLTAAQGRYVHHIEIQQGAIHVVYGHQANQALANKVLRFTPYLNPDQSLLWRCQSADLPENVTLLPGARDERSLSDVNDALLPRTCRHDHQT